jgi:hypothetical protein
MRTALGSNRAEYGRARTLTTMIRMGLAADGMKMDEILAVKLPRKVADLQAYYSEMYIRLKAEGKMK